MDWYWIVLIPKLLIARPLCVCIWLVFCRKRMIVSCNERRLFGDLSLTSLWSLVDENYVHAHALHVVDHTMWGIRRSRNSRYRPQPTLSSQWSNKPGLANISVTPLIFLTWFPQGVATVNSQDVLNAVTIDVADELSGINIHDGVQGAVIERPQPKATPPTHSFKCLKGTRKKITQ